VAGLSYRPVRPCWLVLTATSSSSSADVPVLDPWLGAHDPVISPVELRGHLVGSLERQNEQVRPLLLQTMVLRIDEGQPLRPFLAQPP